MILLIHGVRDDVRSEDWVSALDSALQREGVARTSERGYKIIAPSYLSELEADPVLKCDTPAMTYAKQSQDVYARAAGRYWLALSDLERSGLRDGERRAGFRAKVPQNTAASRALMQALFPAAVEYRKSADRRHAIHARLLADVPKRAEAVIVAHSLGSVVAADLIYHLPRNCDLRMLITVGSPLAFDDLRAHLGRRRNRFPFEIMGPWLNLVGTGDFVTGYRGLSQYFPEALDVFVDTGSGSRPRHAHAATTYLDQAVIARALDWLDRDQEHGDRLPAAKPRPPELPLPDAAVSVLVGAQYAFRLERAQVQGDRRNRFGQARGLVMASVAYRLREAGFTHPIFDRLTRDNSGFLKAQVHAQDALSLLLTAHTMNPIAPYEIELSDDVRRLALKELAGDIGVPTDWAARIIASEKAARSVQNAKWSWVRAAMAAAGVAAVIAMPMLVLAVAPAGLAGGAAIVGGLAALGPGGMLGGVGIVSLLGGAGGALTARALTSGSAEQVEETVIHLQTFALARKALEQEPGDNPEWYALIAMEDTASDDYARAKLFSDENSRVVKELERKLKSIRSALDWFRERSLAPRGLASAGGEEL